MKTVARAGSLALILGLLLLLPSVGLAQVNFGLTGGVNQGWFQGVMGGATQAGSGIPRHVTARDNVVVYRGTTILLPPLVVPALTAQVTPEGGVVLPPVLLISGPLPADIGLAPFSPAGTVATQGAY